ncbi:MAG: cystathionine gamma-synthase [Planctomycetes bacterium]|nr:cystathionine gamma-synthase [Planctomycetota bacterium]MCB9910334.1 cystathionine gamma-synthase [Planctomycetota bacterium]MCB9912055.1 cystathionine gamma-synthase [Planctomycetota bacterium]HPF15103.1 cystathionine gamma-synthase [Planctomycetota bacterium]
MSDSHLQGQFETRAIHAGQAPDPQTGAVMTPVYMTSTYAQTAPGKPIAGYEYSRTHNPTRTALEINLASLEGGRHGLCFSSGLAATNALLDRLVPGDKVVAANDLYGGTYRIFTKVFERYGIEFVFVNSANLDEVRDAVDARTRYVYIETPTNPLLRLTDIRACAEIAHKGGALLVVDNTFATPYLQRPLEMGADVVLHSLTKYLGGHSDVVAGALIVNDTALRDELAFFQNSVGGTPGPMDCFLVMRGTKTLAIRMDRHSENALAIAQFLEGHAAVDRVHYPGLPTHPQYDLCKRQMKTGGGMVSFELKGGVEAGNRLASSTKIFTLAESLGGVESLIETPPSMTHASIPAAVRHAAGLQDGLVRLSVGIEHIDDLIADLDRVL